MNRAFRLLAPLRPDCRVRKLGFAAQRREYYWWDSHDSVDDFKARLTFIFRSEGVENPEHSVERLMRSRRVHSLKDVIQHALPSLKYYVRPPHLITRVYRRIQRETGSEVSATAARMGTDRDEAQETDDGRLSAIGVTMHQRGTVDPRILRYEGPKRGNYKRHTDPDIW
ncbi:hypothetical protein DIPPA_28237 [Diplonema papillatum]|nr:hypothetical protein DIPPA_28237 [Diplonema papillatum]